MANALYPLARQAFGAGNLNWTGQDFKVVLLTSAYTYDAADEFESDLTGIIDESGNLAGKTNVLGVMDANDVVLSTVTAGSTISQLVVFQDTGTPATSRLVLYFDRLATSVLIDVDTDNGDVTVIWSDGMNKIFKL